MIFYEFCGIIRVVGLLSIDVIRGLVYELYELIVIFLRREFRKPVYPARDFLVNLARIDVPGGVHLRISAGADWR